MKQILKNLLRSSQYKGCCLSIGTNAKDNTEWVLTENIAFENFQNSTPLGLIQLLHTCLQTFAEVSELLHSLLQKLSGKWLITQVKNDRQNMKLARLVLKDNKPGLAQVGAISEAQKYQKDFKMSEYW